MKAVGIAKTGNRDKIEIFNLPVPIPSPGQVLVKMAAAPVNFIDTIIREGNMPPNMMPALPFVFGGEGSGVIADANNTELKKGQKVAFLGAIGASAYADYAVVDRDKLVVLDDNIDLNEAAVIPVNYFTAYHMLHNVAKVQQDEYVLIYAASGGVGTALIQLAKLAGLKVIALERHAHKLANARENGADHAFVTEGDWVSQIQSVTADKQGVKYIFNPVAGDTIKHDFDILAPLGHIVIFGFLAGAGESNLQLEAMSHFGKAPTISYSEIYATFFNQYNKVDEALRHLFVLLADGKIKPKFTTLPLEQAAYGHELIESGQVSGKLLLIPSV